MRTLVRLIEDCGIVAVVVAAFAALVLYCNGCDRKRHSNASFDIPAEWQDEHDPCRCRACANPGVEWCENDAPPMVFFLAGYW